MEDRRDELAIYRANSLARSTRHPAASPPGRRRDAAAGAPAAQPTTGPAGSAGDVIELRAEDKDAAALAHDVAVAARELAAATRKVRTVEIPDTDHAALDRLLAARDRAVAAFDRTQAALDRHRAAEYLRRTYRDTLTGTLQREVGRDQLGREVDRAHRMKEPMAVAFVDVDQLKRINDERGHAAGDEALRAVGNALRTALRSYDIVMRYGGDEFVCALP